MTHFPEAVEMLLEVAVVLMSISFRQGSHN